MSQVWPKVKNLLKHQETHVKTPKWIQINPNRPNQVSPMMKWWWTTQPSIASSWYSKCPESLAQNGLQFHLPRWVLGTTGLHISCGYEEVKHEESNSLYTGTMWHSQNKSKRYACSTIYTYMCDFMLHISRNNLMQCNQQVPLAKQSSIMYMYNKSVQSAFLGFTKPNVPRSKHCDQERKNLLSHPMPAGMNMDSIKFIIQTPLQQLEKDEDTPLTFQTQWFTCKINSFHFRSGQISRPRSVPVGSPRLFNRFLRRHLRFHRVL